MKQITSGLRGQVNKSRISSCVILEQAQAKKNMFNMLKSVISLKGSSTRVNIY